ncbi:MAG: hypothetical protein LUF90_09465 [Rikenellaceae bacterium]|nr:hypothetical protein [Rikenellaceae bacterium]
MKKVIVLLLVTGLFSCAKLPLQDAERVYSSELIRDTDYGVVMHVTPVHYDIPPATIRLEITNKTDSTIEFGANYTIDRYDTASDEWIEFGPPEGTAVIAIMYMLEPEKTQNYNIGLFPDKISCPPGTYRITKRIYVNEKNMEYYAPFVLDE